MSSTEEIVKRFYSEIWNNKNYDEISSLLSEDFTFRGSLGHEKKGHNEFLEYVNLVHSGLLDYKCIIEDVVATSEKAFAKMIFTGLHSSEFMGYPATHKQISWAGAALFHFSGNKISSLWVLGDLINLQKQLDN